MQLVTWGSWCGDRRWWRDLERVGVTHTIALRDSLFWGPQHIDLQVQALLRTAHQRDPGAVRHDAARIEECVTALAGGEEVFFWCEPSLGNCLAVLWALACLAERSAPIERAMLAFGERCWPQWPNDAAEVAAAIACGVPAVAHLEPLVAVRRELASDSETIQVAADDLPPPLAGWLGAANLLAHLLPNRRGLDVLDMLLLGELAERWRPAVEVVADALERMPAGHSFGDWHCWERLTELSGHDFRVPHAHLSADPVEARFHGTMTWAATSFRITARGLRVRDGRADGRAGRRFARWVGGRLITERNTR